MVLSVLAPLGAVAAGDDDEDDLSIDVEQNGDVLLTVTENESTVENATVNVTVDDEDASYDGADEYKTDEDGTVKLPEPDEDVEVSIEATYDGASTSVEQKLEAADDDKDELEALAIDVEQNGDVLVTVTDNVTDEAIENATVNVTVVDEDATYDGADEYKTDENGTVELIQPDETVDVTITATYEDESVTTEATLLSEEDQLLEESDTFGDAVSSFVASLDPSGTDGGIGSQVSAFVTENNPGNAPDHAGPPEHAGPGGEDNETDDRGPPEHAGPGGDDEDDDSSSSQSGSDSPGNSGSASGNSGGGGGPP